MRRLTRWYAAVIAAALVVIAVIVSLAWAHGEINNTVLKTVKHAPAGVVVAPPAAALTALWHTTDRAALGSPLAQGTVVTYAEHVVQGRNARTGKPTWSYLRSNRTVCSAAQTADVTIALFRVGGNCGEVTALDTQTGARKWSRTLDEDGHPVLGTPQVQINTSTILFWTPETIYAIDLGSGIDHWKFDQPTCTIRGVALGSAGALISQTCAAPDCGSAKFCGKGPQLLLRDAIAGQNGDDQKNPDKITWDKIGNTDRPISADTVVSSLASDGRTLRVLASTNGDLKTTQALDPAPAPAAALDAQAVPTDAGELLWLDGRAYALSTDGQPSWHADSFGPPTLVSQLGLSFTNSTQGTRVSLTASSGVLTVDATTGERSQTSTGPRIAAGSIAYPLASGFLVADKTGVTAYS
jgi:outer membrane protein assembly factor BamB